MSWEEVCHWIAQGAVNISEGKYNTFEEGSPTHRAMTAFCEYVNKGCVKFSPHRRKTRSASSSSRSKGDADGNEET